MKKILIKFLPFLLIIFLVIPLILPFLHKGFFVTHDGEWAIVRLTAYNFALRDGQLPPRWADNLFHTFGYPVLNFNYPLPPMIGEMFHLVGFSFVDSVKAVFIMSVIFSAFFIYLLIQEMFGSKLTSIFASLIYVYYPFRLVDLYVRGSIGESLSFAILPLVYWSLIKLKKRKNKQWLAISGLSIALLILAHNSLALVSLPFIFLFMIFNRTPRFIASLLIGFALSCFFWLPALYEKQWTILKPEIITKPTDHFLNLQQLIFPSKNPFSFQLGSVHLLFFVIGSVLVIKKKNRIILFFLTVSLLNIFFVLPASFWFWQNLPWMAFMSYPWRILVPIGFYLTVVGSLTFFQIKKIIWRIIAITATIFILFLTDKNQLNSLVYIDRGDMFYITNQSTTIEGDENTPLWVKNPPKHAPTEKIIVDGEYKIIKQKSNLLEFWINTDKTQRITVNTIYYPGWELFVNHKKQKIDFNNDGGLITFMNQAGQSDIKLVFQETPLRLTADIISCASFVLLLKLLFL